MADWEGFQKRSEFRMNNLAWMTLFIGDFI